MRTQYIADDGKVFTSRESAEEYEKKIQANNSEQNKMKAELDSLEKKISKYEEEHEKLVDQYIELSESYIKKYGSERQRELLTKLQNTFSF